ncbi:ABC transporter [Rhodoferax koreense]|uniref:ABC transporter n=1 Tax=Rhodoferax koreensis TaxID=1842727 RepID=A0A1P8K2B0_9BURK|nr:ATP-binding cassette domain-containing protein [Rhodoferax koreense]APW40152.1 ABC transporter [Rhodoferax koreense]
MNIGRPLLHIEKLNFAYPGEPPLLRDWSASIGPGVTQLFGDTGSGKSTLLRVMAGGLKVRGRLVLCGADLDTAREAYLQNLLYVDPGTDRFDQVTGHACTETLRAGDAGFDAARWQALVGTFNLAEHIAKPMYMLSTGSKRKVWLAAALASGRRLILLDEPTGGLDGPSVRALWASLGALAESADRAVVVASSERIERVPLAATIDLI